jgi:glucokinase
MNDHLVVGVDIGGSHITAALVDLNASAIVPGSLRRDSIDSHAPAPDIIDKWSCILGQVMQKRNGLKVGIAIPGPFDYEQGISYMRNQDKYEALYGLNIRRLLAEKLGGAPEHFLFLNDAGSFLQGEVFGGTARENEKVIGVSLGTGLGSARYQAGLSQDADLWCMPFLDGMAEDYLSTRWFVKRYWKLSGNQVSGVKELADLQAADQRVQGVFEEFGRNLGAFLLAFIRMDKPDRVVIGGNIANALPLFLPETKRVIAQHHVAVELQKAALGENAVLIGAAFCWHNPVLKSQELIKRPGESRLS